MPKPNVLVVSSPDHYALRNLEQIRDLANVVIGNDVPSLAKHAGEAEIVVYGGIVGRAFSFTDLWPLLKNVRWIHSLSAGVEKLLFPELIESPVVVTNARGVFKRPLAEFAVLGILYFYKEVRRLIENQRSKHWDDFMVDQLPERIMGVVGYGEIGRECAALAKPLGMKVYAIRRNPERSSSDALLDRIFPSSALNEMLSQVDVVVASAPLTPETHHMLSDAQFAAMKPTSLVINVGRGPVVDEAALIRALQDKKIAAAALDVFEHEPLPESSPLWDMPNVLISPHCTDRTRNPDWLDSTVLAFIENFNRFIKGQELLNVVDKKAGY
ncbi:MAG: D-2-hydroxyacid dehydrogenase [Bryobacteraceae bacterium]